MERRRFEGLEVITRVIDSHPEHFMDLLTLLGGLEADIFYENNHVVPHPDPDFPNRYSAPFDRAVLIFTVEAEGIVVRLLQATFWGDFVPN